jgi:hypothetical protein
VEDKSSFPFSMIQASNPAATDPTKLQGFVKMTFAVRNVRGIADHLKSRSATLLMDVTLDRAFDMLFCIAVDNAGNYIQLVELISPEQLTPRDAVAQDIA